MPLRRRRAARRPHAHQRAHVGEGLAGDRVGPAGALGQDRLEAGLVTAQLGVALADRRQVLDHRLADGGLEVAVAGAAELRFHRRRLLSVDGGEDFDQVGHARLLGTAQ